VDSEIIIIEPRLLRVRGRVELTVVGVDATTSQHMPEFVADASLYHNPRHLAFLIYTTAQIRMTLLLVSKSSMNRGDEPNRLDAGALLE